MNLHKKIDFFVGIDPGVNNGFAIYDTTKKELVKLQTLSFWELINTLQNMEDAGINYSVVIEDPNLNSSLYNRHTKTAQSIRDNINQKVGSNKRTATLIMEWLGNKGRVFRAIRPTSKSLTKIDVERFGKYTKWIGKSSEHSRDAAMLVFGRTC